MPSKPGKPGVPEVGFMIGWLLRSVRASLPALVPPSCGLMYLAPNSALKPVYPPGSSGSRSGLPLLAAEHSALPAAQCTAKPTKSVKASLGLAVNSAYSGEPGPNTSGMSKLLFSKTMLAVEMAPKSQPARVKGTHGAGALCPSAVSMLKVVSVGEAGRAGSKIGSVQ